LAEYLVTGGAGFIGSAIVRALAARGGAVRALDDFSSGPRANLEGLGAAVEIVEADVRDRNALRRALSGVRVVFHHAALVSVPISVSDPSRTESINVGGTIALLEEARAAGAARVVLASSCAVYGQNGRAPSAEDAPISFASPYALSKWVMEEHARLFTALHGLETVSLRYFNVYGPRQAADSAYASVVPLFIRALLRGEAPVIHGDGAQTRDFVFVDDVVRANLLAAEAIGVCGPFNVGTGEARSVLALFTEIAKAIGSSLRPRHVEARAGDLRSSLCDARRAVERLGFRSEVRLAEGLARTIAWSRDAVARTGGAS